LSERVVIAGGHGDTRLRLSAATGQASPSDSAFLSLWASEPGATYTGTGIGNNINGNAYYGRISTARGASYIRLLDNTILLNTINSSGTDTNVMYLNGANVGVGVSPSTKLHVNGSFRSTSALITGLSGTGNRMVAADASGNLYTATIPTGLPTGSGGQTLYHNGTSWLATSNLYSNGVSVGIGTTEPMARFEVNGATAFDPANPSTATYGMHFTGPATAGYGSGITWGGYNSTEAQAGIYVKADNNTTSMYFGTTETYDPGAQTRMTINSLGNVGIGTITPVQKLDVNGPIIARGIADNSAPAGDTIKLDGYGLIGNRANLYITNSSASGLIQFGVGGVHNSAPKMTILSSGNVGIGTGSPLKTLEVYGSAGLRVNQDGTDYLDVVVEDSRALLKNNSGYIELDPNDATYGFILRDYSSGSSVWSNFRTVDATIDYLDINLGNSVLGAGLVINDNDNVGIGTITPGQKLDVNGYAKATGFCIGASCITTWPGTDGDGVIGNEVTNATNATLSRGGSGTAAAPYTLGLNLANANTWTGAQTFSANTNFPGSGIWTTAGNVGIGVTTPSSKLYVNGATSNSLVTINQTSGWTGSEWALSVSGYTNLNGFRINAADGVRAMHKIAAGGQFGFSTQGDDPITFTQSVSTERMRIAAGGNVGVGTASPGAKLHVVGDIYSSSNVSAAGSVNAGSLSFSSGSSITTDGTNRINLIASGYTYIPNGVFYVGGRSHMRGGIDNDQATYLTIAGGTSGHTYFSGAVGIGSASPSYTLDVAGTIRATSDIYANAFLYNSSDRRLKKNIQPLSGSLAKLQELQGVSFNWRKSGRSSLGFIAQDVELIYPELVSVDKEGYKAIAYEGLIAPLVEAVKAQQAEIESLESRLEKLEARVRK
jgi:hypothetical protein